MFLKQSENLTFSGLISDFSFLKESVNPEELLNESLKMDNLFSYYMKQGEDYNGLKGKIKEFSKLNSLKDSDLMNPIHSRKTFSLLNEMTRMMKSASKDSKLKDEVALSEGFNLDVNRLFASKEAMYDAGYAAGQKVGTRRIIKFVLIALLIIGIVLALIFIIKKIKERRELKAQEISQMNSSISDLENAKQTINNSNINSSIDNAINKLKNLV